jgi:lipopolysaccharide export system protein LptA
MSSQPTKRWRELVAGAVLAAVLYGSDAIAQQKPQAQGPANAQQKPQAQGPANALQGFSQNRDEPVKIRAGALEVREKDKMATFTGDVHVVQGDTEMRSKVLIVFYEEESGPRPVKAADPGPGGDKQIRRIEAKGSVVVTQKDQTATGDAANFNMRENTVILSGNVVVTRGADILRGQRLVVDLTSGVSKMDQGRVEALIQSGSRAPAESPLGNPMGPRPPAEKKLTPDN